MTLRHRDGRLLALTYSYLSGVAFDPATGITLTFVGHAVSIQGRRLKPVFDAVASQRAMDLAEAPGDVDEGVWSAGTVMGLIDDIPTCEKLLNDIVAEAEDTINGRLKDCVVP